MLELKETRYGFVWGQLLVERVASTKQGHKVIQVKTPRRTLEIVVTKTGLIRTRETKPEKGQ